MKLMFFVLILQTMGGDFSSKGQQDCAKGIYALAGERFETSINSLMCAAYSG
jgi:hypothetical protein